MSSGLVSKVLRRIAVDRLGESNVPEFSENWFTGDVGQVVVASYAADFDVLWGVSESARGLEAVAEPLLALSGDNPRTIALVWEGAPESDSGPIDTATYLTPIDWGVAVSLVIGRRAKSAGKPPPPIRIVILDLESHNWFDAPALRYLRQVGRRTLPAMPWLTLYPIIGESEGDLDAGMLLEVVCSSISEQATMRSVVASGDDDMDIVRSSWTMSLAKTPNPDDHHAIGNFLGPQCLLGGAAQGTNRSSVALRELVASLDLYPSSVDAGGTPPLRESAPWLDSDTWIPRFKSLQEGPSRPIKILVVDDQWRYGWGEMLCSACGVEFDLPDDDSQGANTFTTIGRNDHIVVRACDSAEPILRVLEDRCEERRFDLEVDGLEGAAEILFLDLRLFAGRPASIESRFVKRVAALARRWSSHAESGGAARRSFDSAQIDQIEIWADELAREGPKAREDPRGRMALTLLPRVLSQVDLSYPIIIFSSTGRREIMARFDEHGNVITTFDKPRFFGQPTSDLRSRSREGFLDAMRSAFDILDARQRCCKILRSSNPYDHCKLELDSNRKYHLELYIDETDPTGYLKGRTPGYRPSGWRVGGCYALYEADSAWEAEAKADSFDDILVESGVRYFDWASNGPQPRSVIEKKGNDCIEALSLALDNAELDRLRPKCFGVVSLYQSAPEQVEPNLCNAGHDDQLFLSTLSSLVEAFLFETVPAIMGDLESTISLVAATRANFETTELTAAQEEFRVGITWKILKGGVLYQESHREDDFIPLVRGVLRRRPRVDLRRALATFLPYRERDQLPSAFECRSRSCRSVVRYKPPENVVPEEGREYDGVIRMVLDWGAALVDCGFPRWGLAHPVQDVSYEKDDRVRVRLDDVIHTNAGEVKYKLTWLGQASGAVTCSFCGRPEDVRPSPRALHYVADQILTDVFGNGKRKYWKFFPGAPGEFEESMDDQFHQVLEASRALDVPGQDVALAVTAYPVDSDARRGITAVTSQDKPTKPAIRHFVRWRISRALERCDGHTFMRVVQMLKRERVEAGP